MAFNSEKTSRLSELLKEIQERQTHSFAAATYKDAPALKEIISIVEEQLLTDTDKSTLIDSIAVLKYTAERFDSLGRFSVSAKLYKRVLELAVTLKQKYDTLTKGVNDIFYNALLARNFYIDDDCEDLTVIASELMKSTDIEKMLSSRKNHRRSLKHDSVEMSEEYLSVIDEVEERIEKNRTLWGHGSCLEVWSLKREYLAGYGIEWHSIAVLNPTVRFD